MTKSKRILPMPGKALVQMESYWDKVSGCIVIPGTAAGRLKTTGIVLEISPDRMCHSNICGTQLRLKGERVLVKPYAGAEPFTFGDLDRLCIVRIDDIEAITDQEATVSAKDGAVLRCKWCGPAKPEVSSNAMILQDSAHGMYCPRCMRGVNGEIIDPDKATVRPGEVASMLDRIDRAKEAELIAKGGTPKRKIISTGA